MRVEPRKRNHIIGAKWLRQGRQNPVTNQGTIPVRKGEDVVGQTVAKVSTKIKKNPVIVGIKKEAGELIK